MKHKKRTIVLLKERRGCDNKNGFKKMAQYFLLNVSNIELCYRTLLFLLFAERGHYVVITRFPNIKAFPFPLSLNYLFI